MQMLRSQLIRWLVYIAIMGILMSGIDNAAHLGGFLSGFALGKIMVGPPAVVAGRMEAREPAGLGDCDSHCGELGDGGLRDSSHEFVIHRNKAPGRRT